MPFVSISHDGPNGDEGAAMRFARACAALGLALTALVAEPSTQAQAPAAASPGAFVWHDLVTDNPAQSRAFYSALFGWTFAQGEGVDPGYTIIRIGERPIAGIVPHRGAASTGTPSAQWLSYVVVGDVDKAVASFKQAGGRVYRGPLNARKDLRVAAVEDAQGAAIGLTNRGPRTESPAAVAMHDWLWMEYVARDVAPALAFYGDALGFRHEISDQREDFTYYMLSTDRPHAGLFKSVFTRESSAWLPYVRVDDPAAMAQRASALGGTVLLPPMPRVRNNSLAIVLDPLGAPIALQKFPFDRGATP
jgi:predicted enzyme related to lactoylglutathione lyase